MDQILYHRDGTYIPRIAAIHDLCGYGKCSLGVAIPMLSAAGCDVCPVPTGLFSSHTAFPAWYAHDTTSMLEGYIQAWGKTSIDIDAVYSGFLGAPEQVETIRDIYQMFPSALRLVDPVMADNGTVYPTYTPELCQAMTELASEADILTPNLTEAAIILGIEWPGSDIDEATVRSIIEGLLDCGAKNVVLKGIDHHDGFIHNYIQGKSAPFSMTTNDRLPHMLHGTGDLYASALLAAIMTGRDLVDAARFAGDFVADAIAISYSQPDYQTRGVSFEPVLGSVSRLLSK